MYKINATIKTKKLGSTPTGYDEVTGEAIFTEAMIAVKCSLEQEDSKADISSLPGVDSTSLYLTGRCVSPKSLPKEFTPGEFLEIEYDAPQGKQVGRFYLLPTIRSRLGLETVFGDAIEGWLV